MREDQIIETEDDVIDLGAATELTFGRAKPDEFEANVGIDHKAL
ncbi:MAG: hypothetical protein QM759_08645 [Terricaulis sp.]